MDKGGVEGGYQRIAGGDEEKQALLNCAGQSEARKSVGDGFEATAAVAENSRVGVKQQIQRTEVEQQIQGYDPSRIPASVFARATPGTPVDWSVASNESLFSIHMGNSNFSGDHGFLMGYSVEAGRLSHSPPETEVGDGGRLPRSPSSDELGGGDSDDATAAINARMMEDVMRAAGGHGGGGFALLPEDGVPFSRHSDASSIHSFAFPILAGEGPSMKVVSAQQMQWEENPEEAEVEGQRRPSRSPQKRWFRCFSCSVCHAD